MDLKDLHRMPTYDLLLITAKARSGEEVGYKLKDIASAIGWQLPSMSLTELLFTFFITREISKEIFTPDTIFAALRKKSGQQFDDNIDVWMLWYFKTFDVEAHASAQEEKKYSVGFHYGLYKITRKALKKLGKWPDEK